MIQVAPFVYRGLEPCANLWCIADVASANQHVFFTSRKFSNARERFVELLLLANVGYADFGAERSHKLCGGQADATGPTCNGNNSTFHDEE